MAYKRPTTDAQRAEATRVREEKLVALQGRLSEQVQSITTGEQWAAWLRTAGRFHTYSWGNTMLIQLQKPEATKVAGYKTWTQVGRQVRKGETGITILAPVVRNSAPKEPEATKSIIAQPEQASPELNSDKPVRRVLAFLPVTVFDISQTDGDPLAEPPRPQLTRGQAPEGLWEALAAQVKNAGFDLSTSPMAGPNGPDGVTNFLRRTVTVRNDVDEAHMCTTLGHELAHVLMHDPAGFVDGQTSGCRGDAEVEAESVAYLVASVHGVDADDYTFPYVAGWIGRNKASTVLEATGKRVLATAHDILEQVETSMVTAPIDNDTIERPSLVLARAANHPGITPQSAPRSELPAPEALAAQARWAGPVSAAGGVDLVQEPIWPQVANALERAATSGIDLTDDLPNFVNGQWVARLRLMHNADPKPTDNATEAVRGAAGEAARSGVRAQMLATTLTGTQSAAIARSR
jgi:N-terminal domain of anti-restriction factor ArdC